MSKSILSMLGELEEQYAKVQEEEDKAMKAAQETGLDQADKNFVDLMDKYPNQANIARNMLKEKSEQVAKLIGETLGYLSMAPESITVAGFEFMSAFLLFSRVSTTDKLQEMLDKQAPKQIEDKTPEPQDPA